MCSARAVALPVAFQKVYSLCRLCMKILNFIFNQLGFIVVLSAVALVYFNIIALSVDFFVILTIILLAILILSETIYANLQRYSK